MPFPPSINIKVERTSEHLQAFNDELVGVLDDLKAHSVVREVDANTGDYVWYFRPKPDRTDRLSILAGDFVHNLRSVLDHIVWALIDEVQQKPLPEFPIYESPGPGNNGFHGAGILKIWTMPEEAKILVERFQPYKSGNEPLRHLRNLDNIDKHRRILTGLYAIKGTAIIGPSFRLDSPQPSSFFVQGISMHSGRFEAGDEIARASSRNRPDQIEQMQVKPTFQITLEEQGISGPFADVMNGLNEFVINKLLPAFVPLF